MNTLIAVLASAAGFGALALIVRNIIQRQEREAVENYKARMSAEIAAENARAAARRRDIVIRAGSKLDKAIEASAAREETHAQAPATAELELWEAAKKVPK